MYNENYGEVHKCKNTNKAVAREYFAQYFENSAWVGEGGVLFNQPQEISERKAKCFDQKDINPIWETKCNIYDFRA